MIAERIILPSQGIPYNGKVSGNSVMVKPITTRLYKDFLVSSGEDGILNVIDGCLVNENIKAEDLIYQDQLAIYFKIRSISLGSEVKLKVKCPHCNNQVVVNWDLMNASCEYLSLDKYPFEVELPDSKERIKVILPSSRLRRIAREESQKRADSYNKKISDFLPQLSVCTLLKVPDCRELIETLQWYEELSLKDTIYIDEVITNIQDFGISTQQQLNCPECKKMMNVNLMLDSSFFRTDIGDTFIIKKSKGVLETGPKDTDTNAEGI